MSDDIHDRISLHLPDFLIIALPRDGDETVNAREVSAYSAEGISGIKSSGLGIETLCFVPALTHRAIVARNTAS
jgi:hypothetical protein